MSATPEGPTAPPPPAAGLDLASRIERAERVGRTPPRISRRAVATIAAVFVAIGVGGGLADNYLNAHVVNPAPATATTTLAPATVPASRLHAALPAFMGLRPEHGAAPAFALADQAGRTVSLRSLAGKVVVISFFDPACNDICPVVAAELRDAAQDLGRRSSQVAFVTIDADPLATGAGTARQAARRSGLGALANWSFLTGPVARLNPVWTAYGIGIDVSTRTRQVAHNDLLWLVSPSGRLAYEATPFANQSRATGHYHLAPALEARFGAGIARYAWGLLGAHPAPS